MNRNELVRELRVTLEMATPKMGEAVDLEEREVEDEGMCGPRHGQASDEAPAAAKQLRRVGRAHKIDNDSGKKNDRTDSPDEQGQDPRIAAVGNSDGVPLLEQSQKRHGVNWSNDRTERQPSRRDNARDAQ